FRWARLASLQRCCLNESRGIPIMHHISFGLDSFTRYSIGVSAEMHCSHNITSYYYILWYKQDGHRRLIFLGYMYMTSVNPEPGIDVTLKGDVELQLNKYTWTNQTE
uniref:Immunoglobulin V-set domain-containing protein n=1 Tax=Esox lucius TaxID=8010 RepID=A0AAY5KBL8_ESOLU